MDRITFERMMRHAQTLAKLETPDYYAGFQRGLRRQYHGSSFGTDTEHQQWLALVNDPDASRRAKGRGYRDGLTATGKPTDRIGANGFRW